MEIAETLRNFAKKSKRSISVPKNGKQFSKFANNQFFGLPSVPRAQLAWMRRLFQKR
jgi:hypothetical protein